MAKVQCAGSHKAPAEVRTAHGEALAKCVTCGRILKARPGATVRVPITTEPRLTYYIGLHSLPGRTTRSHDATMGALWDHGTAV